MLSERTRQRSVKGTPNRPATCTVCVCELLSNTYIKRQTLDQCYLVIYFSFLLTKILCLSLNVVECCSVENLSLSFNVHVQDASNSVVSSLLFYLQKI